METSYNKHINNKNIKTSYRLWLVLLLTIIMAAGCAVKIKDTKKRETIPEKPHDFNHRIHINGGTVCKSCHMNADKKAEAGMPNEMLCGFCHQTVYNDQPIGNYYNMAKWKSAYMVSRVKYLEINMSHAQHISMGIKCEECHGDVANSVKVTSGHIPVKATCFKCHDAWNTQEKCETCHKEIRYDQRPSSHTDQWGSPHHKHCLDCHITSDIAASVRCKDCHGEATAHLEYAPYRPYDIPHRRALMCRACHNVGSKLIHDDNGADCRICHKTPRE